MLALTNKIAIVTGASSGIGRATAKLFAQEGARVVVGARRQPKLEELVAEIQDEGGEAIAVAGDVSDEAYAKEIVEQAVGKFGGLDIAFNNAGAVGEMAAASQISLDTWRVALDTNLTGAFLGAKHQISGHARARRRIADPYLDLRRLYGRDARHGGLRREQGGHDRAGAGARRRIRAAWNSGERAAAGGTDTPGAKSSIETPEARVFVEGLHALKRLARPEEIARTALYLASDASSFTTGAAILADGGVSINRT